MRPSHSARSINCKSTTSLPPRAALRRSVPDALVRSEFEGVVQGARVEDVPAVGDAEAPLRVQVALLVDDHLDAPDAANLGDPALCGFGG